VVPEGGRRAQALELTAIDARDGAGTQQVTLVVDRDQAKRLGIDMTWSPRC
jgi:hypothetical protein